MCCCWWQYRHLLLLYGQRGGWLHSARAAGLFVLLKGFKVLSSSRHFCLLICHYTHHNPKIMPPWSCGSCGRRKGQIWGFLQPTSNLARAWVAVAATKPNMLYIGYSCQPQPPPPPLLSLKGIANEPDNSEMQRSCLPLSLNRSCLGSFSGVRKWTLNFELG